jgi:hypothetical protein
VRIFTLRIGESAHALTLDLRLPLGDSAWDPLEFAAVRWSRQFLWAGLAPACAALLVGSARAQDGPAEDAVAPPMSLDALMRLPAGTEPTPKREKGGATRHEWEERFTKARGDIEEARSELAASQRELEQLASGDQWKMGAPGAPSGGENSPISFKLREQMRRQRDEVTAAERRLTELRIEANLAGVPEDWQTAPDGPDGSASANR